MMRPTAIQRDELANFKKRFPHVTDNLDEYLKILELTKFYVQNEEGDFILQQEERPPLDEKQLSLARAQADKLFIAFGNYNSAGQYLVRFHDQNSRIWMILHNACLFSLPDKPFDLRLWRKLIAMNKPSGPNNLIMRLFPFAHQIEEEYAKKQEQSKEEIQARIKSEFETCLSEEYDEFQDTIQKDWVQREKEKRQGALKKKLKRQLNIQAKEHFSIALRKRPTETESAQIRDYIKQNREKIKKALEKQLLADLEKEYDQKFRTMSGLTKHEFIEQGLEKSRRQRQNILKTKIKRFTTKTPISEIFDIVKSFCYKQADKNLEAAGFFFQNKMSEASFNTYLLLKPQDDPKKIPGISIEGMELNPTYKDFHLKMLPSSDPRAAYLGKYTSCCQSLNKKEGSAYVRFGIENPNAGFYVLCKKLDSGEEKIVSQCLAWRNGSIAFDSIETHLDYRKYEEMVKCFYVNLADRLARRYEVPEVFVGGGGQTPKALKLLHGVCTLSPKNYSIDNYDSKNLYILADRLIPFIKALLIKPSNSLLESSKEQLSMTGLKKWCDILSVSDKSIEFYNIEPYISSINLSENFIENRIAKTKHFIEVISGNVKDMDFQLLKEHIQNGGNVNLKRKDSSMPLIFLMVGIGRTDIVKLLIQYGANLKATYTGKTLLFEAIHRAKDNFKEIVELLVESGASVKQQDENGYSSLHVACLSAPFLIPYLCSQGAEINGKTTANQSPLHMGVNPEAAEMLISYGADLNAINDFGQTPLVKTLAQIGTFGADLNESHHFEKVKVLLKWGAIKSNNDWKAVKINQKNKKLIELVHIFSIFEEALAKKTGKFPRLYGADLSNTLLEAIQKVKMTAKTMSYPGVCIHVVEILLIREGELALTKAQRGVLLSSQDVYLLPNPVIQSQALQFHATQAEICKKGGCDQDAQQSVKIIEEILDNSDSLPNEIKEDFVKKLGHYSLRHPAT